MAGEGASLLIGPGHHPPQIRLRGSRDVHRVFRTVWYGDMPAVVKRGNCRPRDQDSGASPSPL